MLQEQDVQLVVLYKKKIGFWCFQKLKEAWQKFAWRLLQCFIKRIQSQEDQNQLAIRICLDF